MTHPPRDCRPSRGAGWALAVAPSKPSIVYAFIEATPPKNGLYARGWRQNLDRAGPQPEHGLASLLLPNLIVIQGREQGYKAAAA